MSTSESRSGGKWLTPEEARMRFEEYIDEFPLLYGRGEMISFGFPDDWNEIIYQLSKDLEQILQSKASAMTEGHGDLPYCVQVKSKFGGLRFYMTFPDAELTCEENEVINILISRAEDACFKLKEDNETIP